MSAPAAVAGAVAGGGAGAAEAVRATWHLALRELRITQRSPATWIPNLLVPIFFYFVMVASISGLAGQAGVPNYKAFQLPASIIIAVMSGTAGLNMVADIESGYFDKLLLTPVNRLALLVGAMGAELARVVVQGLLVTVLALLTGVRFATGPLGAAAMVLLALAWGLAFSAMGFGIALRTGNSQATQSTWALFLPFFFLGPTFAPMEALSGWLRTAATFNPITYVLEGMRALSMTGWDSARVGRSLLVIAAMGTVTLTFALRALLRRVR